MKITLIQPRYFNIWEALGLGYIGSNCGNHDINFYQAYFDKDEDIIKGASKSDIVGFSCTSPTYQHGLFLAKEIKKLSPNSHIVFGGNHVTAIPELGEHVDQIVTGEGEVAFNFIVNDSDKNPIVTGDHESFEFLRWPDRKLINNNRTLNLCQKMTGKRIGSFQANRGCPFSCKYCAEKVMSHHKIRQRDVNDLLDEIESVTKEYSLDMFKFVDAMFDTSVDYVKEFCETKIKRGINIEWECMMHARYTDEEMFKMMKAANCVQIDVGCESGSNKILKQMRKGVTTDKLINVFDLAKKHGLKRRGFFIIGMPEETNEDLLLTEKLIDRLVPDSFGVTIICPYPGSDYYCDKYKNVDWSKTDEYTNDFWNNSLSNKDLKSWQKRLMDHRSSIHKDRI